MLYIANCHLRAPSYLLPPSKERVSHKVLRARHHRWSPLRQCHPPDLPCYSRPRRAAHSGNKGTQHLLHETCMFSNKVHREWFPSSRGVLAQDRGLQIFVGKFVVAEKACVLAVFWAFLRLLRLCFVCINE